MLPYAFCSTNAICKRSGGKMNAELAVIEYNDGTGHPFWFARSMFGPLADLHGDKAVWKLLESGQHETVRVQVDADIPLDVDTWEDYQQLLAND